jgi:hypothetical protein
MLATSLNKQPPQALPFKRFTKPRVLNDIVCVLRSKTPLFLVPCFACPLTLKLEAACSSETFVNLYRYVCRHITHHSALRYFVRSDVFPGLIINLLVLGRAVAEAVNRWFPTAAARVLIRAAFWVCDGQSGTGAGFLRILRFPLPIIIPPISPSS